MFPQVQHKNPNVQIVTFKNLTPSPFITCFLEDSSKVYFDVDSQVPCSTSPPAYPTTSSAHLPTSSCPPAPSLTRI